MKLHSISESNTFSWNNWWNSLCISSAWSPLIFLNKASPSSLYKPKLFLSNLFAKLFKRNKPTSSQLQPHRNIPLLHQKGWCFSFATELSYCKGVIFLCVGKYWNLLFLFVHVAAGSWCNHLIAFCLLRNKSLLYRIS